MTKQQANLNDETRQEYCAPTYRSLAFATSDLILLSQVAPTEGEFPDDESTLDPSYF